jgi:hypothetical protein
MHCVPVGNTGAQSVTIANRARIPSETAMPGVLDMEDFDAIFVPVD